MQGLRECGKAVLEEMMNLRQTDPTEVVQKGNQSRLLDVVAQVVKVQGEYWKNLVS